VVEVDLGPLATHRRDLPDGRERQDRGQVKERIVVVLPAP
jgi:hypothetical protein